MQAKNLMHDKASRSLQVTDVLRRILRRPQTFSSILFLFHFLGVGERIEALILWNADTNIPL